MKHGAGDISVNHHFFPFVWQRVIAANSCPQQLHPPSLSSISNEEHIVLDTRVARVLLQLGPERSISSSESPGHETALGGLARVWCYRDLILQGQVPLPLSSRSFRMAEDQQRPNVASTTLAHLVGVVGWGGYGDGSDSGSVDVAEVEGL